MLRYQQGLILVVGTFAVSSMCGCGQPANEMGRAFPAYPVARLAAHAALPNAAVALDVTKDGEGIAVTCLSSDGARIVLSLRKHDVIYDLPSRGHFVISGRDEEHRNRLILVNTNRSPHQVILTHEATEAQNVEYAFVPVSLSEHGPFLLILENRLESAGDDWRGRERFIMMNMGDLAQKGLYSDWHEVGVVRVYRMPRRNADQD